MSRHKNKSSTVVYVGGAKSTQCHTGNVAVMHSSKKSGGSLYCGGWTRGAFTDDLAVIDLTGTEPIDVSNPMTAKNDSAAQVFGAVIESANQGRDLPWLAFKIKDFGVPTVERETWVALSEAISKLMGEGKDVLLVCNGGHGRTGTAASIICYLLNSEVGDPVTYVRKVYCKDAVETFEQHRYVHKMLGLPEPEKVEYKHDPKPTSLWQGWTGGYGGYQSTYQQGYVWNSVTQKWEPPATKEFNPPPAEGDAKGEGWWLDDLIAELEANSVNYDIVSVDSKAPTGLSSTTSHVEVCTFGKDGLVYYEVISYDKLGKTVKVHGVMTGDSRQIGIEFLATREEVDRIYGQP